jgi:hypothetical protein
MNTMQPALWWRRALHDTIAGVVVGLVTAGALILIEHHLFPPLLEFGEDIGMRANVALARMRDRLGAMPIDEPGHRVSSNSPSATYVFLDVDPDDQPSERGASGASACEALTAKPIALAPVPNATGLPSRLDCHDGRPVNRYLLAEVVSSLRARGARLIVLDVRLASEAGVVPAEETDALAHVLGMGVNVTPVVFAAPVQHTPTTGAEYFAVEELPTVSVRPDAAGSEPQANDNVFPAIAATADDHPVRRYARCVNVEHQTRPWPTLPWQAIRLLHPGSVVCTPDDARMPPPRIVFTLPGRTDYESALPQDDESEWARYRSVYKRCKASDLWRDGGSGCAEASLVSGKVVVVGASNPMRGDEELTPIGYMSGAEVVINAIRSFEQYPALEEPATGAIFAKKIRIVLACAVIWFGFNVWRHRRDHRWAECTAPKLAARVRHRLGLTAGFLTTLVLVLALTLYMSLATLGPVPSFDIFLGVLALSLEQYAEAIQWMHHGMKSRLHHLLGLGDKH